MHPLVKQTFELARESKLSQRQISSEAGLVVRLFYHWSHRSVPIITNLEAVLNVLGYKLQIVKKNGSDRTQ